MRQTARFSAAPAVLLWLLLVFMVVAEVLPVIMRDCASLTWAG